MIWRIAGSLGLVAGSLSVGYWLGRTGRLRESTASRIVAWLMIGTSPLILCFSMWRMNLRSFEPWLLPFIAVALSAAALLPAFLYARADRLTPARTGSFLTCAFFSNVGYFGSFAAFAVFGEQAYALCQMYLAFFTPSFYTLGFWMASHYGHKPSQAGRSSAFGGEIRFFPLIGMAAGIGLSFLAVPRPEILSRFNSLLIPVDTAGCLIAIGSQMSVAVSWKEHGRPGAAMCLIKFLYTPLIAWAAVALFGLSGLTRKVVLLESAMPVGVSPLLLPLLFGLDRRLSHALWWITTVVGLAVIVAALWLLVSQ